MLDPDDSIFSYYAYSRLASSFLGQMGLLVGAA